MKQTDTARGIAGPNSRPDQAADGRTFWIGDIFVEPRLNQITSGGRTQHLEHRVMQVLLLLAAQADEVVSREAILKTVWGNIAPNDEGLTQAVCKLRKALGDHPSQAKMIQTVRKVGYRLVAPVSYEPATPVRTELSRPGDTSHRTPTREIRIRVNGSWLVAMSFVLTMLFVVLAAS